MTDSLNESLAQVRAGAVRADARLKYLRGDAESRKSKYATAQATRSRAEAVNALLVSLADSSRELLRSRCEQVVTLAVKGVFGDAYSFRFRVEVARSTVQLYPEVSSDGKNYYAVDDLAGGVIDVVAFALRVVLLSWARPRRRQVLVADEPFRHVSDGKLPAVAAMLKELSAQLRMQFIIVSHEPTLAEAADRHIKVTRTGPGRSAATWEGMDDGR